MQVSISLRCPRACAGSAPVSVARNSTLACRPLVKRFVTNHRSQQSFSRVGCRYKVQDDVDNTKKTSTGGLTEHQVHEIMNSEHILLEESMPIRDAIELLLESNVSGAPVVNQEGVLVGMLSESDLLWKGVGHPHDHFIIPPVFLGFADALVYLRDNRSFQAEVAKVLAHTVGQAMSKEHLAVVEPGCSLPDAAELMLEKRHTRLPVVSGGKVVGVLSRQDVMRALLDFGNPYL